MEFRRLFLDMCIGVALGMFMAGAVIAIDSPQLGAYLLIGAIAISAIGSIEGKI